MLLRKASVKRKATIRQGGEVEFAPAGYSIWAWSVVVGYLIYATAYSVLHFQDRLTNILMVFGFGVLLFAFGFSFPNTIVVTSDGLEQISWLWTNKRIRWADVVEVNTGGKSRTVTITGADGTKIVHSRVLPDRPRFLMEMKQHCGKDLPPDFPREEITGS